MTESEVQALIVESLRQLLEEKGETPPDLGPQTQIFGGGSIVDSLDLVGVIVKVEEALFERTGKRIEVVDESSVISDDSPFRTIESLARLISKKLREA